MSNRTKLSFKYENQENLVLEDINFVIERNSKIGFVGSTGSGKSTLFRLISGMLQPSSGLITCSLKPALMFQNPDHQQR